MHDLRTQFTTLQEGIGQSQKRIQDLGNKVEAATAPPSAPVPRVVDPAPGAPAPGGSTAGAPPAAQLFDMARQNLRRGATGAARDGFDTFLKEYPAHERAGEAQMWIADAYAQEGNRAAADSVYALVVTKYSTPDVVSRSLYKRAMALKEVGQAADASKLFQMIVDKYPRADERDLAVEMLRTLKKP
jgi:tol-pal system protein YbgF